MLLIILYMIVIASLFLNKFERATTFLFSLVMGYFAGTVSIDHSNDTDAYQLFYGFSPDTYVFETGYMKISSFFFNQGIDYFTFRTLTYLIMYILLWIGVKKIAKHPGIFYSLYFPFAFINDATQVRNFWVLAVLIFAISFLNKKNKISYFISVSLIILAAQFQNMGYLYIVPCILYLLPWNKNMLNISMVGVIVLEFVSIILSISGLSSQYFSQLIQGFDVFSSRADIDNNLERYATSIVGLKTITRAIFETGTFSLAAAYIFKKFTTYDNVECGMWNVKDPRNKFMILVIFISLLGIPISYVSMAFDRIIRNAFIIIILLLAKNFDPVKKDTFVLRKNSAYIFFLTFFYALANYLLTNLAELSLYMLKLK